METFQELNQDSAQSNQEPKKKFFNMRVTSMFSIISEPVTIRYYEWTGPPNAPTVICCHGLTGNGRNFDFLARTLCKDLNVICPDMPGRGESTWLKNVLSYNFSVYAETGLALLDHLENRGLKAPVDWVGISMGGLIGMMLAARSQSLIRRLVLDDVGPFIYKGAAERMRGYVGVDPTFTSLKELENYLRVIHKAFGPVTDEQWHYIAMHSAYRRSANEIKLNYDPAIGLPFRALDIVSSKYMPFWLKFWVPDFDCWPLYDQVTAETLVLRGAVSDVLRREDALEMTRRGPKAKLVEFEGIGHVPILMSKCQIEVVSDFLLKKPVWLKRR